MLDDVRDRCVYEVDLDPKNHPERVDAIDGALGEGSLFHQTHGFYVHGVPIKAATLPRGWQERTRKVTGPNTNGAVGYCLEVHDLACSKLAAFREKDREFVRILLREKLVKPNRLTRLIHLLPLPTEHRARLTTWVDATARDLRR